MSKEYEITLPIVGKAFLTVTANSEEEALDLAFSEVQLVDVEEWEAVQAVVRGNVLYAPLNEPIINFIGDSE